MSSHRSFARRAPHITALTLLLILAGGLSASLPASAATPSGTVELSPSPPSQTQAVPPNIALTFDDSGSMDWNFVNDHPPYTRDASGNAVSGGQDWSGGPWRCANVIDPDHPSASDALLRSLAMNGVYYNPNITYKTPTYADGTKFNNADSSLKAVWVDGITVNRPQSPATAGAAAYNNNAGLDSPSAGATTDLTGKAGFNTTWYLTMASSCSSSVKDGNCSTNPSGKSGSTYFVYVWGAGISTSGTTASGVNLQWNLTGCSGQTNCTKLSSTSSGKSKYSVGSATTTASDDRWKCGTGSGASVTWSGISPMDGKTHTLSDGTVVTYPNGGPYYYRLKTGVTINLDQYGQPATTADLTALYTAGNWEAVPVTDYQNFANWYAYYRTRNQMARSSLSLVFGALGGATSTGGYGSSVRLAWQNLNSGTFQLPSNAIISSLFDTSACAGAASTSANPSTAQRQGGVTVPPACYRSAFFNFLFQVPASGGTPTRSAIARAGEFFKRGKNNTSATGNLLDPYWQPGTTNADGSTNPGQELYCRQNYSMLVTDGLWNGDANGPVRSTLTLPSNVGTLPDGVAFPDTSTAGVSSIYADVPDSGDTGYASLSDIAFHYWAIDLRTDLYKPTSQQFVTPYMPDKVTGVVATGTMSGSIVAAANVNDELYFNPNNDPASWPHMDSFMVGLGTSGQLSYSKDHDCLAGTGDTSDACMLRKGLVNSSGATGWPLPNGSGSGIATNIDDTWHAALAGRGKYFSASNPNDLVTSLLSILSSINERNVPAQTSAISAAVLTNGTLGFTTGYSPVDWSGLLTAVFVNVNGTLGSQAWDAGVLLDAVTPSSRVILTSKAATDGSFAGGMTFSNYSSLDAAGQALLMTPASVNASLDTGQTRVDWLRGVRTSETNGTMRVRNTLLGAIIRSQAVYEAYPADGYRNTWPDLASGSTAPETAAANAPAAGTANVSYEQFSSDQSSRKPVVYVGANDGMLHAFDASQNSDGSNTATSGKELWAYVPRSAYTNLGNLTLKSNFTFQPTVDATPVIRDVFFSTSTSSPASTTIGWHTILVGGLGQGGRGVYALDVTDPDPADTNGMNATNVGSKVLWEFNAGMPVVGSSGNGAGGTNPGGKPADLGYTYGQPNIGRLANGKWVVLVPGGYFPDCSQPDQPSNCAANTTPPSGFSSLFVLDAQTGALINELKTPTTISGVTSYGLSSPVLGDYNNDQVDDVAFAGDLAGNLWRFDLTNPDPSQWKVTLAYKPTTQGAQPITVMPRLFPDPVTNRFIVVFGTGKYLGAADNTPSGLTQAMYGIRDTGVTATGTTNLVQQQLNEVAGTGANANNTIIGLTSYPVPASNSGWYFNLIAGGERVVVTPGALFDTNRAVITTLIPNSTNGCASNNTGSLFIIDATTGGAGDGVSSLAPGDWTTSGVTYRAVGGLVDNPPTGGTVPTATAIGGGALIFPGQTLTGGGTLSGSDAIWRRRSWKELLNGQ